MAGGVSKHYESQWVYNPGGTRFEDKVGKILSRGVNLQETFKREALHTAKKAIAFENQQAKEKGYSPADAASDFYKQTDTTKPPVDARGMVWVDAQGETIGPATKEKFSDLPPPLTPKQKLTTESQRMMASMSETERSMHMWRKINPGCMEVNTKLPISAYKDHFHEWNTEQKQPVNKEKFRLKSDFTMYCDASIRAGLQKGGGR